MINGIAEPNPCKDHKSHVWTRYRVDAAARSGGADWDDKLVTGDVRDFSVCDKCHTVCYEKPLLGIINTFHGFYIDEEKLAELEASKPK